MTPGSDIDKASVVYNTAAAEQSLSGEIRNSFEIHRNDTQTVVFIPDDLPSTTNIDKQVASLTEHPTVKKLPTDPAPRVHAHGKWVSMNG